MTVSTTMICDYFSGKSRERWLAGQTATASLSALAIIPLGGVLAADYGWHGPFYIYIYSLLLVSGVAIFIWEPPPEQVHRRPGPQTRRRPQRHSRGCASSRCAHSPWLQR